MDSKQVHRSVRNAFFSVIPFSGVGRMAASGSLKNFLPRSCPFMTGGRIGIPKKFGLRGWSFSFYIVHLFYQNWVWWPMDVQKARVKDLFRLNLSVSCCEPKCCLLLNACDVGPQSTAATGTHTQDSISSLSVCSYWWPIESSANFLPAGVNDIFATWRRLHCLSAVLD